MSYFKKHIKTASLEST